MFSSDIRKKFKNYFTSHAHHWQKSVSLIPEGDSSLLFINAGMNPFKDYFLGLKTHEQGNVCSIQKCLRVSGKHNDLKEVGASPWHHTFFEMLGTFSFGKYLKKEAIDYALQFLVKELGLDRERLLVSVFKEDKETYEIWRKDFRFPVEKIVLLGEQDNFWRMGEIGLCGPCTEIYYHLHPGKAHFKLADCLEIWNLVFMSFNNTGRSVIDLPRVCIDTGMGMERLAMILQEKTTNYETDLFSGMMDEMKKTVSFAPSALPPAGQAFHNLGFSVLADHARAVAFLLSEGLMPSGEGRGYVLRKILRRASYYDQKIREEFGVKTSLLAVSIRKLISVMGKEYPELKLKEKEILEIAKEEQLKFFQNLNLGRELLRKKIKELKSKNRHILSGKEMFILYDTYGFPFELTAELAREETMQVDESGFREEIKAGREASKKAGMSSKKSYAEKQYRKLIPLLESIAPTQFTGYKNLKEDKVGLKLGFFEKHKKMEGFEKAVLVEDYIEKDTFSKGETFSAVLDKTPFYPVGGGQVEDRGEFLGPYGKGCVRSCFKVHNRIIHVVKVKEGYLRKGERVNLVVSSKEREATAIHHSATHLLHSALRLELGEKVKQAGSLVDENKLRFDFTYSKPLKEEQIKQVEVSVNEWIREAWPVEDKLMDLKQAINQGALAFFEDHYGDQVRVLKMGPRSLELCGGTHVENTKDILLFLITGEEGVGAGVRRITAVAGPLARDMVLSLCQDVKSIYKALNLGSPFKQKSGAATVLGQIQNLKQKIKRQRQSEK